MMWSSAFCRTFHNVEGIELIVLDCFALFVYDMLESERSSYLSHLFVGDLVTIIIVISIYLFWT
jgi:hypothetical protein